jgi:hypothetical protein
MRRLWKFEESRENEEMFTQRRIEPKVRGASNLRFASGALFVNGALRKKKRGGKEESVFLSSASPRLCVSKFLK